jgi:phosphoenolpyruvate---glycerone phosphotransferase subunit DhaM
MIGMVIVSHSAKAAEGVRELALQMAAPELSIIAAGGMADNILGTDAIKIQTAIEAADSGDGVLVLVDLGSAVLSTDLAIDLLTPELKQRVLIADAPLLEGAVMAAIEASVPGSTLQKAADTAEAAKKLQKRL